MTNRAGRRRQHRRHKARRVIYRMREITLVTVAARRSFLRGPMAPDSMLLPEYKRMTRDEAREWCEGF